MTKNAAVAAAPSIHAHANGEAHPKAGFWTLTLGSIGVVYGDIGTSPLYAVRESVLAAVGPDNPASEPIVLGILSLIIWALLLIVTAKYILILFALFAVQSRGTARVAAFFGPITLVWFIAIAAAGIWHIAQNPAVLLAFNPIHGVVFLASHGIIGLLTLGAVFLVVTGSEALYADLGHFGPGPIRTAWLFVALPALTINYLGQGALVLADQKAIENPFFLLYPDWALLPMVLLATAATVIASQAVITGAYSLTRQAIQLGLLPRLEIRHTSEALFGQLFMPRVTTLLLIGVLLLVALFRSSSALASAYGIAVTGTMVVTAMMAIIVIRRVWRWSLPAAAALIVPFLVVDLTFLAANLLKVMEGGWVPLE